MGQSKRKYGRLPIVLVTWLDAVQQEAGAPGTPSAPGLAELHEVGFLIDESPTVLLIGMEGESNGCEPGRWRLHIPKNSITDVQFLTPARKKPIKAQIIDAGGLPPI